MKKLLTTILSYDIVITCLEVKRNANHAESLLGRESQPVLAVMYSQRQSRRKKPNPSLKKGRSLLSGCLREASQKTCSWI